MWNAGWTAAVPIGDPRIAARLLPIAGLRPRDVAI
jgi:hypothetical protein